VPFALSRRWGVDGGELAVAQALIKMQQMLSSRLEICDRGAELMQGRNRLL